MTIHAQTSETYRGFEIYLADPRLVAPFFIRALRRACRDFAHGHEIIDAYLSREPVAGPRIVSADVRAEYGLSASECRRRAGQARRQRRQGGRFA